MPTVTHNRRCQPRAHSDRTLAAKFAGVVAPLATTAARTWQGVECMAMFSDGIDSAKLCWARFGRDDP